MRSGSGIVTYFNQEPARWWYGVSGLWWRGVHGAGVLASTDSKSNVHELYVAADNATRQLNLQKRTIEREGVDGFVLRVVLCCERV